MHCSTEIIMDYKFLCKHFHNEELCRFVFFIWLALLNWDYSDPQWQDTLIEITQYESTAIWHLYSSLLSLFRVSWIVNTTLWRWLSFWTCVLGINSCHFLVCYYFILFWLSLMLSKYASIDLKICIFGLFKSNTGPPNLFC